MSLLPGPRTPAAFHLACQCGGRRRTVADIAEREEIVAILTHLGIPTEPPLLARARDPSFETGDPSGSMVGGHREPAECRPPTACARTRSTRPAGGAFRHPTRVDERQRRVARPLLPRVIGLPRPILSARLGSV